MNQENAFLDANCGRCGRRFGWHGRAVDRPECPHCGSRPSMAQLEADQRVIDNYRELLAELREANPHWRKWQKARIAAGLTLRQAARILAISPTDLSKIEQGELLPLEGQALRMSLIYSGAVAD